MPEHDRGGEMIDARSLRRALGRYNVPSNARGLVELGITLVPLAALWFMAWFAFRLGHAWATVIIAIPAAGFLVRLFMIQHDCGHGSFFAAQRVNDWIGRLLGVLTLTPYDCWRREHAIHHASSGNLDRRGIGDIDTLTVGEYLARSRLGRLRYRLYRHPVVMFGVGPAYFFLLQQRLPAKPLSAGWLPWVSAMATNGAIALLAAALAWAIGIEALLLIHMPIVLAAASVGVWLFYVQHQFEHTSWDNNEAWSPHAAALHGSSHYDLPAVLRWFTANIGLHHVHHLNSRIPFYRLPRVLQDRPELRNIGRLTLVDSFRCVRLALWDGTRRRLVSFREASRSDRAVPAA